MKRVLLIISIFIYAVSMKGQIVTGPSKMCVDETASFSVSAGSYNGVTGPSGHNINSLVTVTASGYSSANIRVEYLPTLPQDRWFLVWGKHSATGNNETHRVLIVPNPNAPNTPTSNNSNICSSVNTTFTTTDETNEVYFAGIGTICYSDSYEWEINPSSAGSFVGDATGRSVTVNWNNSFSGTGQVRVRGINTCGALGEWSSYSGVTIAGIPSTAQTPIGNINMCVNSINSQYTIPAISTATSYAWELSPSTAGSLAEHGTSCIVNWDDNFVGQVTLRVRGENSCYSGSFSQGLIININDIPTVSISNQSICLGETATLTAPSGMSSYLWSNGATTQTVTVNPDVTTNYSVTVTNSNGCSATGSVTVSVNSVPVLSFVDQTICFGETSILTAPAGMSSYFWSNGATTQTVTVNPNETTSYSVTVTNSNGCSASGSITVNVEPVPTISIENKSMCIGQTAVLTAPAAMTTYQWSNGATTQSITVSPGTTTSYSVTVTNGSGCSATGSATVTVNPLPSVLIPNQSICLGESTTLTAPAGMDSYIWSTGSSAQSIEITPSSTLNYTITATDNNGCRASSTVTVTVNPLPSVSIPNQSICSGNNTSLVAPNNMASYLWSTGESTKTITVKPNESKLYTLNVTDYNGCVNTTDVTITVYEAPIFEISDVKSCSGDNKILTAPSGYTVYQWSNGEKSQSIVVSPKFTQTYTVTVWDMNNCTGSSSPAIIIEPIDIDFHASETNITTGGSVVFHSDITQSNDSLFKWNFGDGFEVNGEQPVHTYYSTGEMTVTLTKINKDGCSDNLIKESYISVVEPTNSVNDISKGATFIYPNPIEEQFFIEIEENTTAHIIDMTGRTVKAVNLKAGKNRVRCEELRAGSYVLRIESININKVIIKK